MSGLLENKVCIVTGAGKGIGKAIAENFRNQGAKLALITRSQEDVDCLYDSLSMGSDSLLIVKGDVSDPIVIKAFVNEVQNKFSNIDALVNNAGIRFRKEFTEITDEEFLHVFNVNVMSIFMLCKAVIPNMIARKRGKIINMSSIAGTQGLPELSAYVTSKAAIIGLTKSLALEYADANIQVNAIAPGFCKTSYFENFKEKKEGLYSFTIDRTPMRRWGESKEVADACTFLASDLSSYITGDTINVDGGWSAW